MELKYYFVLGSKLIGLYFLVVAVVYLVSVVPSMVGSSSYPQEEASYYRTIYFLTFLTPVLLVIIGYYLIRSGTFVHDLAFPKDRLNTSRGMEALFTLGIKLYGVFLVADSIPKLLRLISNYIFVFNSPYDYSDTVADFLGIKTNFLPYLATMILGFYFLVWGSSVTRLAFFKSRDAIAEE